MESFMLLQAGSMRPMIHLPNYLYSVSSMINDLPRKAKSLFAANPEPMVNSFQYLEHGLHYQMFTHNYNCGYPGSVRTERAIELSLADYWLLHTGDACEIGAVTPYYWPGRIRHIIDPCDQHHQVTDKGSLFDYNFDGKNVLSISTIEHVGMHDYGLSETNSAVDAIIKITNECSSCLLTLPIGWNKELDEFLLTTNKHDAYRLTFLKRTLKQDWIIAKPHAAHANYGPPLSNWANSLAIIEVGSTLV